ncbi:hypothetical protein ACJZ2D_016494 [Fusarium nematophilum]
MPTLPTLLGFKLALDGALSHVQPIHVATAVLVIILASRIINSMSKSSIPVINPPAWFEPKFIKELGFIDHSMEILNNAKNRFPCKPFRVFTDGGEVIVLPPTFAHEIRNMPALNFRSAIMKDLHSNLPAFSPFALLGHPSELIQGMVRKELTKYLNTVTEPIAREASFAFDHRFGNSTEWQSTAIKGAILDSVARLSSRVFLGENLCRNEAWLAITSEYTVMVVRAAAKLRLFPSFIRPLVSLLEPDCRKARAALTESRAIINPVIEQRRRLRREALAHGHPAPSFNDAIDWAETECKGRDYDAAVVQLVLSFAAIHTTTDLLSQTLIMLAKHPEFIDRLRQEMVDALTADGWKKNALYNMKLLDSAIKEAQRLKPTNLLAMRRLVEEDVTLSDGTCIRRGQRLAVDDMYYTTTTQVHDNPDEYDAFRFKRLREQPGNENKAQLVATSPEQLSFGHGRFACPGRFFAANEVKIALCFLLLKYDWKLAPGAATDPLVKASALAANPKTVLRYRRRKEEISLEDLASMDAMIEE